MTASRISLDKKVQLKKKKENLIVDMEDLLKTKFKWESLSSSNTNALSAPTPVDKTQERTHSLDPSSVSTATFSIEEENQMKTDSLSVPPLNRYRPKTK
jgi:hypothetical protein